MDDQEPLGMSVPFTAVKYREDLPETKEVVIATEVPVTIDANGTELATLMCSPCDLEEFVHGFLFTSGFITDVSQVLRCRIDSRRWKAVVQLDHDPDPVLLGKRLYTSGCGKGVMYASVTEISGRQPLPVSLAVTPGQITALMRWLQKSSDLHTRTHGVHTAALSPGGAMPVAMFDDVGRHNAVDKTLGRALLDGVTLDRQVLLTTGRISAEILHKAHRGGIGIVVSLSAPTHQSILLAQDLNITLVGFAKGGSFTVFTQTGRIKG